MTDKMLVSVIVPTYNRKQLLKNALNSILNQTYSNYEIIIIDDCSTDGTGDYVSALDNNRIKYHRNDQTLYAAESRNRGIINSSGDLVAFLDDDDEWYNEKLEKQVALFNKPEVGIVYSSIELFFENNNISYNSKPKLKGQIHKELLIKNYIGATPSVMIRREALDGLRANKYFDASFPAREEYDLWIRLSRSWEVDFVAEPLVKQYYRTDIQRISTDVDNYVEAIKLLNRKYDIEVKRDLTGFQQSTRSYFQQFFLGSQAIKNGNSKLARKYYLKAFLINRSLKALASYLFSFFGAKAVILSRYYFDKVTA